MDLHAKNVMMAGNYLTMEHVSTLSAKDGMKMKIAYYVKKTIIMFGIYLQKIVILNDFLHSKVETHMTLMYSQILMLKDAKKTLNI